MHWYLELCAHPIFPYLARCWKVLALLVSFPFEGLIPKKIPKDAGLILKIWSTGMCNLISLTWIKSTVLVYRSQHGSSVVLHFDPSLSRDLHQFFSSNIFAEMVERASPVMLAKRNTQQSGLPRFQESFWGSVLGHLAVPYEHSVVLGSIKCLVFVSLACNFICSHFHDCAFQR